MMRGSQRSQWVVITSVLKDLLLGWTVDFHWRILVPFLQWVLSMASLSVQGGFLSTD
jgi:hypothetical protein